jgi:ATP phosphoribosyltransferase regulatory subunit HisZ
MAVARPHFPDLLFEQTARLRCWERALSDLFVGHGYLELAPSLVTEKMQPDSIRCIDGDRIVGLRFDFTEAIATMLATRSEAPPECISYRGAVFRRPVHGWEPVERFEVGVEHIQHEGEHGAARERAQKADRNLLALLLQVPACVGLRGAVLQLGSAALLALPLQAEGVVADLAQDIATWISKRAPHRVAELLANHPASRKLVTHVECLIAGELEHSPYAALLENTARELHSAADFARASMPSNVSLRLDTADVAGFGFYTGPTMRLWAPHAAFELGGGGRYDGLYPAMGKPWQAAGFCIRLARLLDLADGHPELFIS